MWIPSIEQVERLHSKLIARTGGSHGVRNGGLIDGAASFAGQERYPTMQEKAAAICCRLIGNHGFIDGNKRIGIAVLLLIIHQNGMKIEYTQTELIELGLSVAQGETDTEAVTVWILEHSI